MVDKKVEEDKDSPIGMLPDGTLNTVEKDSPKQEPTIVDENEDEETDEGNDPFLDLDDSDLDDDDEEDES